MTGAERRRRLPVGAEVQAGGGVHFCVWAPGRQTVEVVLEGGRGSEPKPFRLGREDGGYFAGLLPDAGAGTLYRYRLDGEGPFPDPASRFQPDGPHGPSQVVDPSRFAWHDASWPGLRPDDLVLYEMHVGTFTPEGTWQAAVARLPELADLGINAIEVMPVAEFPGRFGWGYDGVDLFAPSHLYGTPDDFRRFVDAAHRHGLGVVLDVVYNHFGPEGAYIREFADAYFTDRNPCEWGDAINFDGEDSGPVREFYLANAAYWVDEFHVDGLRIDATQSIFDTSPEPILAAIARVTREAGRGRSIVLIAENEPQKTQIIRPAGQGGFGFDALWNEDFHHTAMVALTGRAEGYYSAYRGTPQEFISALKWGFLYQGQRYAWQRKRRGTPTFDLPPWAFVNYLQNHDQVANSIRSRRLHVLTSPGRYRAMTALFLLAPQTPMLFQGQEFAASSPFHYFADQAGELGEAIRSGYQRFLGQFRSLMHPEAIGVLADPTAEDTFRRSKLDHCERDRPGHAEALALHRDLIRLRRTDPAFRSPRVRGLDGAVLGDEAFVIRYFGDANGKGATGDRLLLVNFGRDLTFNPAPEPLLAPPEGRRWQALWTSEDPLYGGSGVPLTETQQTWRIPGQSAVVLGPRDPDEDARDEDDHG